MGANRAASRLAVVVAGVFSVAGCASGVTPSATENAPATPEVVAADEPSAEPGGSVPARDEAVAGSNFRTIEGSDDIVEDEAANLGDIVPDADVDVPTVLALDATSVPVVKMGVWNTFEPESLTITAGGKVTFANKTNKGHSVTHSASRKLFDRYVAPGKSYTVTFAEPGTYKYYSRCTESPEPWCRIDHDRMWGKIVVKRAARSGDAGT